MAAGLRAWMAWNCVCQMLDRAAGLAHRVGECFTRPDAGGDRGGRDGDVAGGRAKEGQGGKSGGGRLPLHSLSERRIRCETNHIKQCSPQENPAQAALCGQKVGQWRRDHRLNAPFTAQAKGSIAPIRRSVAARAGTACRAQRIRAPPPAPPAQRAEATASPASPASPAATRHTRPGTTATASPVESAMPDGPARSASRLPRPENTSMRRQHDARTRRCGRSGNRLARSIMAISMNRKPRPRQAKYSTGRTIAPRCGRHAAAGRPAAAPAAPAAR